MNPQNIVLSERSQIQKHKYYMTPLTRGHREVALQRQKGRWSLLGVREERMGSLMGCLMGTGSVLQLE